MTCYWDFKIKEIWNENSDLYDTIFNRMEVDGKISHSPLAGLWNAVQCTLLKIIILDARVT